MTSRDGILAWLYTPPNKRASPPQAKVHSETLSDDVPGVQAHESRRAPTLEPLCARDQREPILRLFRENGKEHFTSTFDWHYGARAVASRSWCLRRAGDREIVGFVSVFERQVRFGDSTLRAGAAGDLMLAREARSLGNAVSLIRATQIPLKAGELDFLITQGNVSSNRLVKRLGYRPIGAWQLRHLLLSNTFRKRTGISKTAAAWLGSQWARRKLRLIEVRTDCRVELLSREQLRECDTAGWCSDGWLSIAYRDRELAWRYLDDPRTPTLLAGIRAFDGRLVGYAAIVERDDGGLFIRDFLTDSRSLSDVEGLRLLVEWGADRPRITMRVLQRSQLATEVKSLGFVPGRSVTEPVMALWLKSHPRAGQFANPRNWRLLPGYSDV